MRFLTTLVLTLVGAVAVILASPAVASAESGANCTDPTAIPTIVMDAGDPVTALPGSFEEAEAYALREAASPEVQDYAGGDVIIGISVLAVVVIVVLIIIFASHHE